VLRVVFPVVVYGDLGSAPWMHLAPDLLTMGVALLVFFQPEKLLGLWRKSRPGGAP
jgi:hypothetical protein